MGFPYLYYLLVLEPEERVLHETGVRLVRIVADLMQADELVGESIARLRLGQVESVLLLEAERVVDVRPIGRQLMVEVVKVSRHRVDRCER